MANEVKICENTVEGVKFELYSDNDKYHYQKLVISREGHGHRETNRIAPVDFFAVATAFMCNDMLCDVITDFGDTWTAELLENMVDDLFEE